MRLRNYNYAVQGGSFVWFKNVSKSPVHLIDVTWDGEEVRALHLQDSLYAGHMELCYLVLT